MLRVAFLIIFASLFAVGCQQPAPEAAETKSETAAAATTAPTPETTDSASEVKVGMGLAEVKKILGAPDDARHEHGANDSEIDIWIYKDAEVKFENGKVVEHRKK